MSEPYRAPTGYPEDWGLERCYRERRVIGDCTLYLGDCLEILPNLTGVDAIVTDPPYGIGVDQAMHKAGGTQYGSAMAAKRHYEASDWDSAPPDQSTFDLIRSLSRHQIIFGGNYFGLPASRCWLVWDKQNGENDFADCELAWTNLQKAVRRIYWRWNGMIRKGHEERFHPTQKPLGVMAWCLTHLPANAETICDPFMGSGTTGVACVKAGKRFIGIEQVPEYFDIAYRRIEDAYKQGDMFVERPAPPKQEPML